jgi:hypothetical protein
VYSQYVLDNRKAEQIISFGLTFFASLLEHPGIWDADIISPNDPDSGAQEWIEQNIFTSDIISQILRACVCKFLILTSEEALLWKDDALKFFINMKEESNEVKGNFLRLKALRLIAAVELRFSKHF